MIKLILAGAGILPAQQVVLEDDGHRVVTYSTGLYWMDHREVKSRVSGYCLMRNNHLEGHPLDVSLNPKKGYCMKFKEGDLTFIDPRKIEEIVNDFNDDSVFHTGPTDGR